MDYVHGGGHYMRRIFVPEAANLVFGVAEGKVFAFTHYDLEANQPDILAEINLPDELVKKALKLAIATMELSTEKSQIEDLLHD
ncbi:hypothetical protein A3K29_02385 [Candidatus Collierbacteria bacterium RIFOXYB2_FULL_46_14]|uniref:Uncharacterized protein n=1 Tax=Candidatus Collierbacteria bacterium GW2011_GWA2_46_26 TaxID=1618381 RepID=A0A0G1SGN3_9BACT|nr:MAG: hypothetical protein UW29_C0010G0016 [Candidatus Collierbacteria bacterium GW2011_GWC2_44_13]KKU32500.1 MAG: hypothetical protein UX47_C0010G0016 [Candidatus Collierbacteria bacterium GW2011_GWA2_46_26]OGD72971.1 MAG: hypothetical protein A3K29_02385 [Candidatus Collierbacteria bacterium RIFOXYB2_FULL_46_14]OGD76013.1 MAG: hypothetical protein A3K43_02385 [Candidatus Collierbacteria bacterium RIFOXYA2_FULL_46_20]OGD77349.1 MAG: hypothetical protein A3K39_02385 [Candidatus Collierbacteri